MLTRAKHEKKNHLCKTQLLVIGLPLTHWSRNYSTQLVVPILLSSVILSWSFFFLGRGVGGEVKSKLGYIIYQMKNSSVYNLYSIKEFCLYEMIISV